MFQSVVVVKDTAAVRFHLGLALERLGRRVEALNEFTRAVTMTSSAEESDAKIIHEHAQAHASDLESKLALLMVTAVPGARVTVDDVEVSAVILASGVRLEPGLHRLAIDLDGHERHRSSIELTAGAPAAKVVLEVGPPLAVVPSTPPPITYRTRRVAPWAPWLGVGVGAAAFVSSGVFYALRANALSTLNASCGGSRMLCPASLRSTYDQGVAYSTASEILFSAGVVATLFGAGFWLLAPTEKVGIRANVGVGSVSLVGYI
jgi:hypothetical protein